MPQAVGAAAVAVGKAFVAKTVTGFLLRTAGVLLLSVVSSR